MTPAEIKSLRIRQHWTQDYMARELGVSWATVNRWENGKAKPSNLAEQSLKRLAARTKDRPGS